MNLAQIVEPHPAEKVALSFEGVETSYGRLRELADGLRGRLCAAGVSPGERVGLLLGATPGFVVSYLAVLGLGAVAVPLNPSSPLPELERELAGVGARLLLCTEERGDLGTEELIVEKTGECEGPAFEVPPICERAPFDPAVLLFTSGTAGLPRAAVLSHENLLSNIEQVEMRVGLAATPDDVGLLAVPPYHVLGLNAVVGVELYAGAKLVLVEHFDADQVIEVVRREQVSLLVGVPQLFAALAASPLRAADELRSVRLAFSGGAPLSEETARSFSERFGLRLWQGYGLTEASPAVTCPDINGPWRPSSVGVPLPGIELRLIDEQGDEVEPGDPGEILVRGPNVFPGYFEDEGATRQSLDRAGWLHTGDVGVFSEDGELSIVDRRKDLAIVSGFNVYPGEVEEVLESHPLVAEAAAIGLPDEETGERLAAFVVPVEASWPEGAAEPELGEEEVLSYCAANLARYKCPRSVSFLRQLPRNSQGKVLRRELA